MTDLAPTLSAPTPPRPVLGVSVCVWREGEVLLVRRGNPPGKGLWAPVGGRVEWGETLEDAARREVFEEAAIDVEIVGFSQLRELIEPGSDDGAGHHVVLAVFAARWRGGAILAGDDADAVSWVGPERLVDYDLVPGVVPFVAATRELMGETP